MNFELNLIENSYDYIKETLYYYKKIGYGESHDEDRNYIEEKRKDFDFYEDKTRRRT